MPVAAEPYYRAALAFRRETEAIWKEALAEGIVTDPLDSILLPLTDISRAQPATLATLGDLIAKDARDWLEAMARKQEADYYTALRVHLLDAAKRGLTRDQYAELVVDQTERWATGDVADTWDDALGRTARDRANLDLPRSHPQLLRAWPYMEYDTQRDDRVRPRHRALQGFLASINWPGWAALVPPLGWRCRCFLRRISFGEARARGLSGLFPAGKAALDAYAASPEPQDWPFVADAFPTSAAAEFLSA